jgi:hypothetical protein
VPELRRRFGLEIDCGIVPRKLLARRMKDMHSFFRVELYAEINQ